VLSPGGVLFITEMCAPPSRGLRSLWHKQVVEPWIKRFWGFRDVDPMVLLEGLGFTIERPSTAWNCTWVAFVR